MASREETYGNTSRRDVLVIPAERLTLITDPEHDLYDHKGVHEALTEEFINSIMWVGIKEPITIRVAGKDKNGQNVLEIVNGRHRWRGVIEANKRLRKQGEKADRLHQVPCIVEKGSIVDAMETMVITNRFRHEKSVLDNARLAKRLIDRNIDPKEVARDFGVHPTTIGNWLRLLKCCPEVQEAVEQGMPANAVKHLHELDPKEQKAKLAEMIASGATKGEAAMQAAKNGAAGKPARPNKGTQQHRMKNRAFCERLKEQFEAADTDGESVEIAAGVVGFLMGDNSALDAFPELVKIVKPLLSGKKTKKKTAQTAEAIDMH